MRKYPTKPLESWRKCKELRLSHYQEVAAAREQGKILVTGSIGEAVVLPSGLGDFVFFGGEPYGAAISVEPAFAQVCAEAYEAQGYARDTCAYFRNYMGSMFLGRYFFGGPFPRPHFCLTVHNCDTHAKWYQTVSEYLEIPFFGIDFIVAAPGARLERRMEYLAAQLYDAIEWMEKVTGRKYDDEKFIRAIYTECEIESLWAEICLLNQAVPAPLEQKTMWSLYLPGGLIKHKEEVSEFYRMLRDEVKERVANGIAALATERCRLLHDGQPPWFFLKVFRILEGYGAVCVGSQYAFGLSGYFQVDEGGIWRPGKSPWELGVDLRSRDDAVRYFAYKILAKVTGDGVFHLASDKVAQILQIVGQWHADGVVMHLNRGCEGLASHQMETRLALLRAGIPVVTYEGNMADKREFDETQVIDRLESFAESIGLHKLDTQAGNGSS